MTNTPSPTELEDLSGAETVSPAPITGRERPDELLQNAFPAFVGR